MPVTNYYTVAGTIIGEQTTGSGRIDYLTDALGSVTATVDQTGTVQNTYRYKPYGALLAKTGMAPDPKFGWVGSMGYRQMVAKHSDKYVRARHYGSGVGRWTTNDPIGYSDDLNRYQYGYERPTVITDPTGLACSPGACCCKASSVKVSAKLIKQVYKNRIALGNKMTIRLVYEYDSISDPSQAGDCSLQYFEKTNIPGNGLNSPAGPGEWKDDLPANLGAPGFEQWVDRKKPCPGAVVLTIHDSPSLVILNDPLLMDRILCFRIILSSGGSACTGKPVEWDGYQIVSLKQGTAVLKEGHHPYCSLD